MARYTENVKVRLTPEQKERLQQIAHDYGVSSISEFIREVITTGRYEIVSKQCVDDLSDLIYELNRIGNNLNQIARYVNINKELDRQALNELAKIREMMDIILEVSSP